MNPAGKVNFSPLQKEDMLKDTKEKNNSEKASNEAVPEKWQDGNLVQESAIEMATAAVPESVATPAPEAERTIATMEKEKAELFDRLLRKQAEMENYRKRVEREKDELYQQAVADVVKEILPAVDACERALASFKNAGNADKPLVENYRAGVELLYKQFQQALRKVGVMAIESVGTAFDPHLHEAVARVEAADTEENQIIEEVRRGYRYRDRLLRPAQVKVAMKPSSSAEGNT
jgi:molecular chaperone GrpE